MSDQSQKAGSSKSQRLKPNKESTRIRKLADILDDEDIDESILRDLRRAAEIIENKCPILDREALLYFKYKTIKWFTIGFVSGAVFAVICLITLKFVVL